MTHELFAQQNIGKHYNAIRTQIELLDWDGIYPEVDLDGCLTGRVVAAECSTHVICDVRDSGLVFGNCVCDAIIELTPEEVLCEAILGSADIEITDEE